MIDRRRGRTPPPLVVPLPKCVRESDKEGGQRRGAGVVGAAGGAGIAG
jgi:hypothetical protein